MSLSTVRPTAAEVNSEGQQNEAPAGIAIRCDKDSPYETGFTRVSNYVQWYWKAYLGPLPISAYESLLSRWYEGKDKNGKKRKDPFPTLETLASELHCDRHTLTGRWRTKDGQRYRNEGLLEILKKHGFLTYREGRLNGRKKLFFTLYDTIPVLTDAQVQQLPEETREKHAEWIGKHHENLISMVPATHHDMVPATHHDMVPIGHQQEDSSQKKGKKNLSHDDVGGEGIACAFGEQGTKASNPTTTPQEEAKAGREVGDRGQVGEQLPQDLPAKPGGKGTEAASFQNGKAKRNEVDTLIREFYTAIGQPKIPPGILNHGRKQIAGLLKDSGYSLADVATAIAYIKNGDKDASGRLLDQRNTPIGAIGYLSYIIAEAVQHRAEAAEAEKRRAATEARHASQEAARQKEQDKSDREALVLAEEWSRNRPSWMSDKYHTWLLKQLAEQPVATAPSPSIVSAAEVMPSFFNNMKFHQGVPCQQ